MKQKLKSRDDTYVSHNEPVQKKRKYDTNKDLKGMDNFKNKFRRDGKSSVKPQRNEKMKVEKLVKTTPPIQVLLSEKLKKAQANREGLGSSEELDTLPQVPKTVTSSKQEKVVTDKSTLKDKPVSVKQRSVLEKKEQFVSKSEEKHEEIKDSDRPQNDNEQEDLIDEELDPEKEAIRKKKREKRRQKKLDKLKKKQEEADRAGTAKTSALEYLKQWKDNRDEWKFLKVRQVWLLQNMYNQDLIDDSNFELVLEYLEGLKGKSRETTVTEAESQLAKAESEETDDCADYKFERARQVIQLLSE